MSEEKKSYWVSFDGYEGWLSLEGFILRHSDDRDPPSWRQSLSLLHVHRLSLGMRYKSIWPAIIALLLAFAGIVLIANGFTELGVISLLITLIPTIIYIFSPNRVSLILETPLRQHSIEMEGKTLPKLYELYWVIETAWTAAQAKLVASRLQAAASDQRGKADD